MSSIPKTFDSGVAAHAVPLAIAFLFLLPLSVIAVRIGSKWSRWFIAHITLNLLSFLLISIGANYGLKAVRKGEHFATSHRQLGIFVLVFLGLQIVLGVIISLTRDPTRDANKKNPFLEQVHWWIGRLIFLLAFLSIFTGYLVIDNLGYAAYIATGIIQCVWVFLYCILLILI